MIQISNVNLKYGNKLVLNDFSFTVPGKGITCFFGPSGCGKTSLARVISGLTVPDSGTVTGISLGEAAFMFQEDRLFPWLTVLENIEAVTDTEIASKLLDIVGLSGNFSAYPDSLSGGMRRSISLCRALAYKSKLLILDEPFTGMDNELKARIYPTIRSYAETRPVILITHNLDEKNTLADTVLEF